MRLPRSPHPDGRVWQASQAGELPLAGAAPSPRRVQPPLREVLKGLDARELEGETVFDQLFGPLDVAQPQRR